MFVFWKEKWNQELLFEFVTYAKSKVKYYSLCQDTIAIIWIVNATRTMLSITNKIEHIVITILKLRVV